MAVWRVKICHYEMKPHDRKLEHGFVQQEGASGVILTREGGKTQKILKDLLKELEIYLEGTGSI